MAFRRERGDSFIREELTLAIRNDLKDPRVGSAVITEVELSKDRRFARVYVTSYEGDEALREALIGLESAKGILKRHLGRVLAWQFTPELGFYADRTWQYGAKIDALFEQIAAEEPATEPPRSEDDDAGPATDS
jgi:ribosome-binding factor A